MTNPEHAAYTDGYQVGFKVGFKGLDPSDAMDDESYARALAAGLESDWLDGYNDGRTDPWDDDV